MQMFYSYILVWLALRQKFLLKKKHGGTPNIEIAVVA